MSDARTDLRLQFIGFLILVALSCVVGRLWWVQVARGEVYTKKIKGSSQVRVRIPSVRGEIRDRNGVVLVRNRASFDVDFYLPDMVKGYRERIGNVPRLEYEGTFGGMRRKRKEADIVQIVDDTVIKRLEELQLVRNYNPDRLQVHYRNDREVPYTYIEDLDFPTMARFAEHDVGLPGVDVVVKPVREYPFIGMAAHILGYVGAPVNIDQEDAKKYDFYQPDVVGKTQIELHMNEYLRGKPGVRVMQKNAKGVIEGQVRLDEPVPGDNVYLTLDSRIQYIAETALRAVGRGAAVVVDPNSGNILAMASIPSYDPNSFIPSIGLKDWNVLRDDKTHPLTNRAVSGYAPGSTYKIPIALAGLRAGLTKHTSFHCSGFVTYGRKAMACWIGTKGGSHGSIALTDAIKKSCNAFFYQYGNAAGIKAIDQTGDMLGLGQKSGLPISGESPGILPGPDWLAEHHPKERWSSGFTANTSIGQGYVLASPLQMAMVVATVANGGVSYYPRLIDKVVGHDGKVTLQQPARRRGDLCDNGLSVDQIEAVRRGMWEVVNESGGTARKARLDGIEVAGKTGTAQFKLAGKSDNHAWFICFAPYDAPRYAVCVFVQGAKSGGGVAAPIAAKILEECFALEKGEQPKVAALAPALGSFKFIEGVDFGRAIPAAYGTDDSSGGGAGMAPQEEQVAASPNIREEDAGSSRSSRKRGTASKTKKPSFLQKLFGKKKKKSKKKR